MKKRSALTFFQALLIIGAAWLVFAPVFHGGWLWDDNLDLLDNRLVHDPAGLRKIWFTTANADYYPLKSSINWIQWRLWGTDPLGYHLTNFSLHVLSALLFWRLLGRLGLKGGWVGGLLFAVHPLAVESVAWIAELKNALSLPFLLLAMTCYVDFDASAGGGARCPQRAERHCQPDQRIGDPPSPRFGGLRNAFRLYAGSVGLFLAAMLTKTSVVMFPFALLLYGWWRHGRLRRRDLWATSAFFTISLILGVVTVWFQSHRAESGPTAQMGGFGIRALEAGPSLVFYFLKCVWPVELMPIYPRWPAGQSAAWPLLLWGSIFALAGCLWSQRRSWGRHALLGLGWFALNLAPTLGLVAISTMRFTAVMDHYVYVSLLGIVGLAAAGAEAMGGSISPPRRILAVAAVLALGGVLAGRSRSYARNFRDGVSLWTYAIEHNPDNWMAALNLGVALNTSGRNQEAIASYERSLRLRPAEPAAHYNLANALRDEGRLPEAISEYRQALRLKPDFADAYNNLGLALSAAGRGPEAVAQFATALRLRPEDALAHSNFGTALSQVGRLPEAEAEYQRASDLAPWDAARRNDLGLALARLGRTPEAVDQFAASLRLKPGDADVESNLGGALGQSGRLPEAIGHFEAAVRLRPDNVRARFNFGAALLQAGRREEGREQLEAALRLDPGFSPARELLAR